MYLGLFEPAESRLLASLLSPGDVFVDVGAHIGWFSTIAAALVGRSGRVVACEPYPVTARRLRDNISRNGYENVNVVETAIGSHTGRLSLATGNGDSGGVTALDWARDGRVEVPVALLDEVTAELESLALLKVDVEGWEAHVLQGASKTLSRTEHVLIEINPPGLKKAGSSAEDLYDMLRSAGFVTFVPVVEAGLRRLHRNPVNNILASRT
jgi:FkbM family methyltransferase